MDKNRLKTILAFCDIRKDGKLIMSKYLDIPTRNERADKLADEIISNETHELWSEIEWHIVKTPKLATL